MSLKPARPTASQKLQQRNRELAILKAIAEELNRALDVKSALENSLALVAELLGLRAGWVWLLDEDTNKTYLAASRMLPPFLTAKPSRMRGTCLCLNTFVAGDLTGAANVNVLECSRLDGEMEGTDGLQYHASIPIYAHDKPLGVMNVASPDWRGLEPADLQLLSTIGFQIGVAVERARLFDQTKRLATIEERNRMAREIHDTIAQGMAAAILNLESAEALLDDPQPSRQAKARAKITKALSLTRLNLEEARRWVLDLRLAPLLEKPLPDELGGLLHNFGQETGLETHLLRKGPEAPGLRYPVRIEAGIYRVAQECLTNVRKHAQASRVTVSYELEAAPDRTSQIRLIVEDNGLGFDPALLKEPPDPQDPRQTGHWGLIGIRERVRLLGGSLEITSSPGQGTRIELVVPVN